MKDDDFAKFYGPFIVWLNSWLRREKKRPWQLRDSIAMEILKRRLESTSLLNWNCGQTDSQNMERFQRHADFLADSSYMLADSVMRARLEEVGAGCGEGE